MNDIKEYIDPLRPEEAGQTITISDKGGYDNIGEKLVPLDLSDALALIGRMKEAHLAALAEKDDQIANLLKKLERSNDAWIRGQEQIATLIARLHTRGDIETDEEKALKEEQRITLIDDLGTANGKIATLTGERDLWKFRAIAVAAHLDYETMSTDIKKWVDEYKKAHEALTAENKRLREALDTIESMATDTTHDIQGIAQAALKEGGKP